MWFSARVLFESQVGPRGDSALQEESFRLIQARDELEAKAKAMRLGETEQHEYTNDAGETVKWRFVEVLEIQDLCEQEIYDGMEVFSLMKWKADGREKRGHDGIITRH